MKLDLGPEGSGGNGVMALFHGGDYKNWLQGIWYIRARMAGFEGGKNVGPWSSWQRTVINRRQAPTILSPADKHIFVNSDVLLKFKSNLKHRVPRNWAYEFEWRRQTYNTKANNDARSEEHTSELQSH